MSITQITFEILEYQPTTFDFTGYKFQIVSEDTKFLDTIYYEQNNKVQNKVEVKTNIKYFIKALYEGELIAIANFTISDKHFYKKTKTYTMKNLQMTMSDFNKKKLFEKIDEEDQNPKKNLPTISLDLKISFNYIDKTVSYNNQNGHNYKYVISMNSLKSKMVQDGTVKNSNINAKSAKKKNPETPKILNSNLIHYKKSVDYQPPTNYVRAKSSNLSINKSEEEKNQSDNSDISIIDSVLIDNEYNNDDPKLQDQMIKEIKDKVKLTTLFPSDKYLDEAILKQKKMMTEMQKDFTTKINEMVDLNNKLQISYKKYKDKLRGLNKKKNRVEEENIKIEVKKNYLNDVNKKQNENIVDLINMKNCENSILKTVFGENKEAINNININNAPNNNRDKEILLSVLRKVLDLNIDLESCFNMDGINKLKYICEKYGLIDSPDNNNLIKEEEENENEDK